MDTIKLTLLEYLSMLTSKDIINWSPEKVKDWLVKVCDDSTWLKADMIRTNNIGGKQLLNMTYQDIELLGATKVSTQEHILEAIENLRDYNNILIRETLQSRILKLSCQSRSLHNQLIFEKRKQIKKVQQNDSKNVVLSSEYKDYLMNPPKQQRVSLDTLASVSVIVTSVKNIINILNSAPFCKHDEYRTMKSLLLALSIELTSTAQRDQFVERPNDIIEKSSQTLADYCDRIVYKTIDPLLIEVDLDRIDKNQN